MESSLRTWDPQLVKKFSEFYKSRRFIKACTSVHYLSLTWARSIQTMSPYSTPWRPILIVSFHLFLCLPSGVFLSGLATKTLYSHLLSPILATCPAHFILLDFSNPSLHSIYCALYAISSLTKINCLSENSKQSNFVLFSLNSIFRYSLLPSSSIFLSM